MARNAGIENTQKSRAEKAKRGKAGSRAVNSSAKNKSLFAKPELDEMTVGRTEKPALPEGWEPPRKTWLEDSREGRSTDGASHGAGGVNTKRPLPRSSSGKPGQRGGFKMNKGKR